MDEERDVEVFERIPWESLEKNPDRRWMAYGLAGAIVLAAIGVSLGRQMGAAPAPVSTTWAAPGTTAPSPTVPTTTTAPATTEVTTWTEADLMALPADTVETGAMALAEWYVVDFFTRDEPEKARSFVEWARASEVEWETPSSAWVTVLVRRLAAPADETYERLEAEAWTVEMRLDDDGWWIVPGPMADETPTLSVGEGAVEESDAEWVDDAGMAWQLRERPDEGT